MWGASYPPWVLAASYTTLFTFGVKVGGVRGGLVLSECGLGSPIVFLGLPPAPPLPSSARSEVLNPIRGWLVCSACQGHSPACGALLSLT